MAAFYGLGRAPERACRPLADWPAEDRRLWTAALEPQDLIDGGGIRGHLRPISNRKVERGYGRWLTFLDRRGLLASGLAPDHRITPANVHDYVRELLDLENGSSTLLARLQELYESACVMNPRGDWQWIRVSAGQIRSAKKHVRNPRTKMVATDDLVSLGTKLISRAAKKKTLLGQALMHRDGLLVAFAALRPLRLKNLASLEIGQHIVQRPQGWFVQIEANETKNGDRLEYRWPDVLVPALTKWLEVLRPTLVKRKDVGFAPRARPSGCHPTARR